MTNGWFSKTRRRGELQEWARGFSLLSDATRLGILAQLSSGPRNVTALCKALGLKHPTISHHLGLLRMGRLVTGKRSGKSVTYEVDKRYLKKISAALNKLTP